MARGLLEPLEADVAFRASEPADAPGLLEVAATRFHQDPGALRHAALEAGVAVEDASAAKAAPASPVKAATPGGVAGEDSPASQAPSGDDPQVSAVDKLILAFVRKGIESGAEALHLQPGGHDGAGAASLRLADRAVQTLGLVPRTVWPTLVARLKIMARLDIAERRRPQDGLLRLKLGDRSLELACFVLPTTAGERVLLRFPENPLHPRTLAEAGAPAALIEALRSTSEAGGLVVAAAPPRRAAAFLRCLAAELRPAGGFVLFVSAGGAAAPPDALVVLAGAAAGVSFGTALLAARRQDPDLVILDSLAEPGLAAAALGFAADGGAVLALAGRQAAAQDCVRELARIAGPERICAGLRLVVCLRAELRDGRETAAYDWLSGEGLSSAVAAAPGPSEGRGQGAAP